MMLMGLTSTPGQASGTDFQRRSRTTFLPSRLHTMYHNFVKIHGAHKVTPAMAAGIDHRLWEIGDIVTMIEEWEAKVNGN